MCCVPTSWQALAEPSLRGCCLGFLLVLVPCLCEQPSSWPSKALSFSVCLGSIRTLLLPSASTASLSQVSAVLLADWATGAVLFCFVSLSLLSLTWVTRPFTESVQLSVTTGKTKQTNKNRWQKGQRCRVLLALVAS